MEWNDVVIPNKISLKKTEPCITFYLSKAKTCSIYFNSFMLKENQDNYISLGYSAKNRAIIIFFNKEQTELCVKLYKRKKNFAASCSIQFFLNACNLDKNDLKGKYYPEMEIIDDKIAYVIYLDKKIIKQVT